MNTHLMEVMNLPFIQVSIYSNHIDKCVFMNCIRSILIVVCISQLMKCKLVISELYLNVFMHHLHVQSKYICCKLLDDKLHTFLPLYIVIRTCHYTSTIIYFEPTRFYYKLVHNSINPNITFNRFFHLILAKSYDFIMF